MLNLQLAHKYAAAIFEIAQEEKKLETYGRELERVKRELFSVPGVREYFADPRIEPSAKKELLKRAFRGEIDSTVYNFLLLLVDKRRIALLEAIEDEFRALSYKAQDIVIADVTTAMTMVDGQQKELRKKLVEVTGKKIKLRFHEDESLIGGVVIKIGDRRIDGSVRGRLNALTQELMRGEI